MKWHEIWDVKSVNFTNFKVGKIAVSSPIAQGLIGKKVGDIVSIKVPSGTIPFEIISISI